MIESGFYPSGAEFDSNAPWNQETPETTISVLVSQTLSSKVTITTTNFKEDEEGIKEFIEEEVKKDTIEQTLTPLEILKSIPQIYDELLNNVDSQYLSKLKLIVDNCKLWKQEDIDIEIQ